MTGGHTLGASTAQIGAVLLRRSHPDPKMRVATVGIAPLRTGNPRWARHAVEALQSVIVVVNDADLVPSLPLPLMPQGLFGDRLGAVTEWAHPSCKLHLWAHLGS